MPFLPAEAYGSSLYIHRITFLVLCPTHNACVLRALPCVSKIFLARPGNIMAPRPSDFASSHCGFCLGQVNSCAPADEFRPSLLRADRRYSVLCVWSLFSSSSCPILSRGLLLRAFLLPNGPAALWRKANRLPRGSGSLDRYMLIAA